MAAMKAKKEARKATGAVRDSSKRKQQSSDKVNQPATKSTSNKARAFFKQPATKSRRLTEAAASQGSTSMASDDGQNECCVCFELYRDDDETDDWLQCACKRWLHEDCISDIVHDKFGRELRTLPLLCTVNCLIVSYLKFFTIIHCKQFNSFVVSLI